MLTKLHSENGNIFSCFLLCCYGQFVASSQRWPRRSDLRASWSHVAGLPSMSHHAWFYPCWRPKLRASFMSGKHSTNWVTSSEWSSRLCKLQRFAWPMLLGDGKSKLQGVSMLMRAWRPCQNMSVPRKRADCTQQGPSMANSLALHYHWGQPKGDQAYKI